MDTYTPLRAPHPKADLSAAWFGPLRTTHDAERGIDEANLAILDPNGDVRRSLGRLSPDWVGQGPPGTGRDGVNLETFVKMNGGLIIDVRLSHTHNLLFVWN